MTIEELMLMPQRPIRVEDVAVPFLYYGHPKGDPRGSLLSLGVMEMEFDPEAGTWALRAPVTTDPRALHERLRDISCQDDDGNLLFGIGLVAYTATVVVRHIFLTACVVQSAKCLVRATSLIEEVRGTFEILRPLPLPVLVERLVSTGK